MDSSHALGATDVGLDEVTVCTLSKHLGYRHESRSGAFTIEAEMIVDHSHDSSSASLA